MLPSGLPVAAKGVLFAAMNLADRFFALQHCLEGHADLWRPRPFCVEVPDWVARYPALAADVLALSDDTVGALAADDAARLAWVASRVPALGDLLALTAVPGCEQRPMPSCDAHFDWAIPGRKRKQIEAFAAALEPVKAPVLEWCAGKGHLGRRLAMQRAEAVTSLEIDPTLCAQSALLATRARLAQHMVCADALSAEGRAHVVKHHVVALHACGELHRTLVRGAVDGAAAGFSIAPCCYDRGVTGDFRPVSAAATLRLDAGDLRLAITESVTAGERERRQHALDSAFKLGFIALRAALEGDGYRPFRPVPTAWARAGFEGFCRQLAAREGVVLPGAVNWDEWQAVGWARHAQVLRYDLVRHVFRRALELWLVGDLALGLEAAGYRASLGQFCDRAITPRNLLVQAARA
ncbi:methyltransferase [Zoogloeaceae bacterium G21618-S1]|nr:methyltransferase [Zoogloeaceae bacterium G21618-S1]